MACTQEGVRTKGPHRAAMEEAARAAAVKPPQRVLFKAACRVDAPQRPGAAKPLQPLVGRRRVPAQPAKKDSPDLSVEVRAHFYRLLFPSHHQFDHHQLSSVQVYQEIVLCPTQHSGPAMPTGCIAR